MCIFTGAIQEVSQTKIFSRLLADRQYLVYEMRVSAETDTAMILPLPTKNQRAEQIRFISLSEYDHFFDDLALCFPTPPSRIRVFAGFVAACAGSILPVHRVGTFDASVVPTLADFSRVDPRFRLPAEVWKNLPLYEDYSFAVFQLRAGEVDVHPMALSFVTRNPEALYFPTSHVHDGTVHSTAEFDHALYSQGGEPQIDWQIGSHLPQEVMNFNFLISHKTRQIIGRENPVSRHIRHGVYPNNDIWLRAAS